MSRKWDRDQPRGGERFVSGYRFSGSKTSFLLDAASGGTLFIIRRNRVTHNVVVNLFWFLRLRRGSRLAGSLHRLGGCLGHHRWRWRRRLDHWNGLDRRSRHYGRCLRLGDRRRRDRWRSQRKRTRTRAPHLPAHDSRPLLHPRVHHHCHNPCQAELHNRDEHCRNINRAFPKVERRIRVIAHDPRNQRDQQGTGQRRDQAPNRLSQEQGQSDAHNPFF